MPIKTLARDMQREHNKWAFGTKVYGTCYVAIRLFLIIASGIVAAEKTLIDSSIGFVVKWVPALALFVTVLTSVDTWMKPREKWRGFMEDRDDLNDLVLRLESVQDSSPQATDNVRTEFKNLRAKHREKNVF